MITKNSDPVAVTTHFLEAIRDDNEAAVLEALVEGSEGYQFGPPDGAEVSYELGAVTVDGDEAQVPSKLIAKMEDGVDEQDMTFLLVREQGAWKIDLDKSMEAALGMNPAELMEGLAEAVGSAMGELGNALSSGFESAFSGLAGSEDSSESDDDEVVNLSELHDSLGNEQDSTPGADGTSISRAQREKYAGLWAQEIVKISDAVGREIELHVDWDSLGRDERALRDASGVVSSLRSAILLMSGYPDTDRALQTGLEAIQIRAVDSPTRSELSGRVLRVDFGDDAYHYSFDQAIKDHLDLERGPGLRNVRDVVLPEFEEELAERTGASLRVEVDWEALKRIPETRDFMSTLTTLEDDLLRPISYALSCVHDAESIGRLDGLRILPTDREDTEGMFVEGRTLVLRWLYTYGSGLSAYDLEMNLPTLIAGVPERGARVVEGWLERVGDASAEFPDFVSLYRDEILPIESAAIQELLGTSIEVDVSWKGLQGNVEAARYLPERCLQRLLGPLASLVQTAGVEVLRQSIQRVRLEFVSEPSRRACYLANGAVVLRVAPACREGFFRDDEVSQALEAGLQLEFRRTKTSLTSYAQSWADSLAGEHDLKVRYEFAWNAFETSATGHVGFALSQMRDHGVCSFYYAMRDLAEDEAVCEQLRKRVRVLRLEHVPHAHLKGLVAEENALVLRQYLHQDYDGYLLNEEIVQRIREVLPWMPELEEDEPGDPEHCYDDEDLEEEQDQDEPTLVDILRDEALPTLAGQLSNMIDRELPLEADWDAVGDDEDLTQNLMSHAGSLVGAISVIAYDENYRGPFEQVESVRVVPSDEEDLRCEAGVLEYRADLDVDMPDVMKLAERLKAVLTD